MLDILELLSWLLDVANLPAGITKFWRITFSCFMAGAAVAVLCFWFDSPAIRLIAGFHLVIGVVTAGVIWERRRDVSDRTGVNQLLWLSCNKLPGG